MSRAEDAFELSHETRGGALIARARGKFDRDAGAAVEGLVRGHPGARCVLNLAAIEYISSSGVAYLARLGAQQGLLLAEPAECVSHTLSLAGIERILRIFPDEAAALAAQPSDVQPGGGSGQGRVRP